MRQPETYGEIRQPRPVLVLGIYKCFYRAELFPTLHLFLRHEVDLYSAPPGLCVMGRTVELSMTRPFARMHTSFRP